ncbi:SLMO2 [Cordylochernes scorpioides]|uniref:SLMO2 n=1 Tax=Cordylochernes scorpioides TaxID=51811 RepID=A0ABY6KJ34_9ARAC|nr:SLMO2 [Cordylochernes scorpioides]
MFSHVTQRSVTLAARAMIIMNASAFVIKTGSTTQWQADLAPKEMAASDMRNRRNVQWLLTWTELVPPALYQSWLVNMTEVSDMVCVLCRHPWEKITQACWRKYPNPLNTAVVGLDVVERKVTPGGLLVSHRLLSTRWGLPNWANKLLGGGGDCYASEHSIVDPVNRTMTLESKNFLTLTGPDNVFNIYLCAEFDQSVKLSFTNELSIVERLTYKPDEKNPNMTHLTQEAVVTVKGVPLSNYLESHVANTISANASKLMDLSKGPTPGIRRSCVCTHVRVGSKGVCFHGRQAMEWVVQRLNEEISTAVNSHKFPSEPLPNLNFDKCQP